MRKLFTILTALVLSLTLVNSNVLTLSANEPYEINHHHSDIIVNEDGTINITETVDVVFNTSRRGIYFQIASDYTMDLDDQQKEYYFPITNVTVLSDHESDISYENNGVTIRLGSEYAYANTYETYKVSYTLHTKDLGLEGYSMLFHNIVYQWDATIHQASFNIEMPKPFSQDDLYFDIGYTQQNLDYLDYQVTDNTITGQYNQALAPYESITILLKLPENYFSYPVYDAIYWLIVGISGAILILSYLLFLKKGKDAPLIVTVEFSAPENTSSAECGYIIDGQVDNRDIFSLIIEWAKDGYLKIADNDQSDLTFSRIKDLPNHYPSYQKVMFQALFNEKDEVKTTDLKEKFYTSINQAKQNLNDYMHLANNRIYSGESIGYRVFLTFLGITSITIFAGLTSWFNRFSVGTTLLVIGGHIVSLLVIFLVLFKDELTRRTVKSKLNFVLYFLMFALFIGLSWFSIRETISYIPWFILILYTIIMAFISQRMIKRTEKGHRLYGQIVGLYQFIQYAEKDRLAVLAKENPDIFYHVLPYAFAFNLTDVWSEHFKDLSIPEVDWYSYNGLPLSNYYLMRSFTRSMYYAQREMVSLPPIETRSNGQSNGGFGGFGGGGFGGGGFSGGGFGGSRGGSW